MILKELNLIGFGKYENKTIKLQEGINIIYGENETGKTTIHSFIDGIFYGFLKPSVKSTIYLDEHKRFEPWDAKKYAGIIKFYYKDVEYRIEREFTKGKEETKVLIEDTGEEITRKIDNGSKNKVLQPGYHFFGFNNRLYSNTVSIKQLATRTEKKLADELRDKLVNISTSLDEEISINNAIKNLETALKEIGSVKAFTSPYGGANSKVKLLQEEKQRINDLKKDYDRLLDDEKLFEEQLDILKNDLHIQKDNLKKSQYYEKKNIYTEAIKLTKDLNFLEITLDELSNYKDLSNEDYNNASNLNNHIVIINGNIEYISNQIFDLQMELENLKKEITLEEQVKWDQICNDYLAYENMEEEKNKLIFGEDNSRLDTLKAEFDTNTNKKNLTIAIIVFIGIAYLISTYISLGSWIFIIMVQLFIIPIVIFMRRLGKLNLQLNNIKSKVVETKEKKETIKEEIISLEEKQKHMLNVKYNLTSKVQLRTLYDLSNVKRYKMDEELELIKAREEKLKGLKEKLINYEVERQNYSKDLNSILEKNNIKDLNLFDIGLKNKEKYDDCLVESENKKDLLKRILGNLNIDQLKSDLENDKRYDFINVLPIEKINSKIQELQEAYSSVMLDKKGIEERISYIEPKISRLIEIEEELLREKSLLKEFDKRIEAIRLAKSTIEGLSKDIHNQFAPEINKKVGNIVDKITSGKYNGVRIDNTLEIGVINPDTGQIIDIDALSGGTIDQLYFSLRFGIINSMVESNLPLILDDCFIQYDDKRLENILKFLNEIGQERQIILFSCHNRERKMLEDMGISFNLITLG